MNKIFLTALITSLFMFASCEQQKEVTIKGSLKTWHRITLEIPGPSLSEQGDPNPFLDYRLEATFSHGDISYQVPGYFAADGNAGESGAISGECWRVHFAPDAPGKWTYTISFRHGKDIAISQDPLAGQPLPADGSAGVLEVEETDKSGKDFRGKGRLVNSGNHYLFHAGNGELFLKGGADSPENLLAYQDFDGTYYGGNNEQRKGEDTPNLGLHAYAPHLGDWKEGDPTWQDGKGKGIIGGLNYLASKGVNSVYFLTMNILGDGDDVWPYTYRNERYRFDCSKLDQWEIVFSHMEALGIMMHVVLQETENEQLLDGGYLDVQRKLYLRELIARFAHHNAITWNLGEEHGKVEWGNYYQSVEDTKKMAEYLREVDPYDHFMVLHTHPATPNRRAYLPNYLAFKPLDGPSIQAGDPYKSHGSTLYWLKASSEAGQPWVVCIDEIGEYWKGALPDAVDPKHDTIRQQVLWGNLMAGGAGVEWYFGNNYANADLNCEDWRSRDLLWDQTRVAVEFFKEHVPVLEMESRDDLVKGPGYCLTDGDERYVIYFMEHCISSVDLREAQGTYEVSWFHPVSGGALEKGSLSEVKGGKVVHPGDPPNGIESVDWVCLLTKKN